MADIVKEQTHGSTQLYSWLLTQADGTGEPGSNSGAADRTVQVFGTFNGASVTIEGSNEIIPTSWQVMHDMAGLELIFTSAAIHMISENPLHIRPRLSGGDGSTSVNVKLLSRSRP